MNMKTNQTLDKLLEVLSRIKTEEDWYKYKNIAKAYLTTLLNTTPSKDWCTLKNRLYSVGGMLRYGEEEVFGGAKAVLRVQSFGTISI